MRSEEQRKQSMKLFEALSYVDESLVDRSAAQEREKIISIYQINRVAAACFCLITVGALTVAAGGLFRTRQTKDGAMEMARNMNGAIEEFSVDGTTQFDTVTEEKAVEDIMVTEPEGELQENEPVKNTVKEAPKLQSSADGTDAAGMINEDLKEDCKTPQDSYRTITWEEAAKLSVLGEFIPDKNWGGYTLEEVKAGYDPVREEVIALHFTWTKGLDSMMFTVKILNQDSIFSESSDRLHMVDINKPETYDVRLYEIPYCDSVPEKFRETFEEPVFTLGEMNPDMVKSRMKTKEDAGDTNTPSGSFGILCDNILLHFNGGMEPDVVWDGIQTIISRLSMK